MLTYMEIPPIPALAPYLQHIRICYGTTLTSSVVPYFPDSLTEIRVNFADEVQRTDPVAARFEPARLPSAVLGPTMRTSMVSIAGNVDVITLTLTPGGIRALLHIPAAVLKEEALTFEQVWSSTFAQQIADLAPLHPVQRVEPLQRILLSQLDVMGDDSLVQPITRLFQASRGQASVSQLLTALPVSERTLDRIFHQYIGLSPKRYLRLVRFNEALRLLRRQPSTSLVQIALDAGYFDQAHFDHELLEITGVSARRLRSAATFGGLLQDHVAPLD